jgi:hypothetical protein
MVELYGNHAQFRLVKIKLKLFENCEAKKLFLSIEQDNIPEKIKDEIQKMEITIPQCLSTHLHELIKRSHIIISV